MRPWKRNARQADLPKDPEIRRWFQALGQPPSGSAPPNLHATVRARIAQQRVGWRGLAWIPHVLTPAWAAVLTAGLVLSLGVNIWLGVRATGVRPSGLPQSADTRTDDLGRLSTYQFQVGMQRAKDLGTIVAAHPTHWEPTAVVGFTPQARRTTLVRLGILYAETVAALHGGFVEPAEQRLDILMRALASIQAPRILIQYGREMHTLLQSQRYAGETLATFLGLFEPLYKEVYTQARAVEELLLFRAGTWLENMYLAAAASDPGALQRGGRAIEEVRQALTRLHAPREVLQAFERLQPLVTKPALTEADMHTIRTLVQDLQERLSE